MKKLLLTLAMLVPFTLSASALLGPNLEADLRLMHFDRGFDNDKLNTTATTVGGVISYRTNNVKNFHANLSYFGSHKIDYNVASENGTGTSLLTSTGDDISFFGEMNVQYTVPHLTVKVGTQRLNTPLANDHDLRMLPSSYRGATATSTILPKSIIQVGYINGYTGFTSKQNAVKDYSDKFSNEGLVYAYIKSSIVPKMKVSAQYAHTLSTLDDTGAKVKVTDYAYADTNIKLPANSYLKAQVAYNRYIQDTNTLMYGAKLGSTVYDFGLAVAMNIIEGNRFKTIESGPMYTDWQQGYGNYEPSTAYGVQATWKPIKSFYFKAGVADIQSTLLTATDDYTETNVDTAYNFNDSNKLRVRYSFKDQTSTSVREDRSDFRIIMYSSF